MTDDRFHRIETRYGTLTIELEPALGDVVFSAAGRRGALKAGVHAARHSSNARAYGRMAEDLRALKRAARPQARMHVGGGMALRVWPNRINPASGRYFVTVTGRRGGKLWASLLTDELVDGLIVAAEQASRHLLPVSER